MTTVNFWDKLLFHVIPNGIKRKMVLVAVFVELERERGETSPRLEDLNAQMHLVDDVAILDRMADLTGVIFRANALPICGNVGILENCSNVIRSLPSWLQYADRRSILHDLAELTVCNVDHRA